MSLARSSVPPLILAVIIVAMFLIQTYVPTPTLGTAEGTLLAWASVICAVLYWVGLINIVLYASRDFRKPGLFPKGLALFEVLLIVVCLGSGFLEPGWERARILSWFYNNPLAVGSQAMFGIAGFWMARAIYRSARARNAQTAFFVLVTFLSFFAMAPLFGVVWSGFPVIGDFLTSTLFVSVVKAALIGLGIATLTYCVRYVIGKEPGAFGTVEEAGE